MALFLTICSSAFAFCAVSILFGGLGRDMDIREKRLKALTGHARGAVDEELEKSLVRRFLLPAVKQLGGVLSRILPRRKDGKTGGTMEKELRLSGLRLTQEDYMTLCVLFSGGLLLISTLLPALAGAPLRVRALIPLCALSLALLLPRYFLRFRIRARQTAIQNQLPAVIDVLSVSMEAGLGFDAALMRVLSTYRGALIDELLILSGELQMGKPRRDALKGLGERSGALELKAFASAVIQSDQLGIPIKNVLRTQAVQLRAARKQRAEEKGMKAPVKMMLPMVAFIFPVIFIILLGPTVIRIMEQFG